MAGRGLTTCAPTSLADLASSLERGPDRVPDGRNYANGITTLICHPRTSVRGLLVTFRSGFLATVKLVLNSNLSVSTTGCAASTLKRRLLLSRREGPHNLMITRAAKNLKVGTPVAVGSGAGEIISEQPTKVSS